MASLVGSIEYRLPKTECLVSASLRNAVITDNNGSCLKPMIDVSVTPSLVADDDHARILNVEHSFGEDVSLDITLDEQGVMTAVNSSSTVDFTPIIELVGKAVGLAVAAGGVPVKAFDAGMPTIKGATAAENLEHEWEERQSALAGHLKALNAQSERLLNSLSDQKTPAGEIIDAGKALETVQTHMAKIIEVRRLWIAARENVESLTVRLAPEDLCLIDRPIMPDRLTDTEARISPKHAKLAAKIGCLIAMRDPKRPENPRRSSVTTTPDTLITRVPRRAEIAVYLHEADGWKLDADSVQMLNLIDGRSEEQKINLNKRSIALSMHPDGTFKTFGLKKTSMLSGATKSIISAADSIQTERDKIIKENAEAAKQAAADKAKQASDANTLNRNNYEFLALIHGRGKLSS